MTLTRWLMLAALIISLAIAVLWMVRPDLLIQGLLAVLGISGGYGLVRVGTRRRDSAAMRTISADLEHIDIEAPDRVLTEGIEPSPSVEEAWARADEAMDRAGVP